MSLLFEQFKEELKQELKQELKKELKEELLKEKSTTERTINYNGQEKINERVKRYRKNKGYTQAYVAKKLNLSPSTYNRYESNGKFPVETVLRLAELLNVSVEQLMLG